MSDPSYGSVPPPTQPLSDPASASAAGYQPPYNGQAYGAPPPPPYGQAPYDPNAVPPQAAGLSDNAAGAIAYLTIIPAIIFLVMDPYNRKPFVKFHAFQCLGIAVTGFCLGIIGIIPILGWIVFILGWLTLMVTIVICIIKASQGGALKLPFIAKFASQQSGYPI